jgi:hypothetical protein
MRRALVIATLAIAACKPSVAPTSDVQSLDNLAGGDTVNECRGSHNVVPTAIIKADDQYIMHVRHALSAVPSALQSAFFEDLRGQIIVQKDMAACGRAALSCWATPADNAIAIYVKDAGDKDETVKNIRHALVRSFGFLTSQFILKLNQSGASAVLAENDTLNEFKSDLTMTLLDDVAKSPKYKLSVFKESLPAKLLDKDVKTSERRVAWDSVRTSEKGQTFMDTVLAEAFDSWYCSKESHETFKKDFVGTYELMKAYAETMEAAFANKLGPTANDSGGGLELWGRWGGGNGPLRQAWANWGDRRASGLGLFNFNRASQGGGWIFNRGGWGQEW